MENELEWKRSRIGEVDDEEEEEEVEVEE